MPLDPPTTTKATTTTRPSAIADPLPPVEGDASHSTHNAAAWVKRWADERPTALAWVDAHRRCDFAEAEDRIARLATWFRLQGVEPGDRVALWLGNRGAMLEAVFAASRLGAIVLPINARLTPAEVRFQLEDATPRLLLVEAKWQDKAESAVGAMGAAAPPLLRVGLPDDATDDARGADAYEEAIASVAPTAAVHPVRPEDPMILMYTSGTTGQPKGALLPHRKALFNGRNAEAFFGIEPSDRVLVVAPLFHSLGLQILALPAVFAGAGLVLQEGFSAERVWATIEAESVTYYGGVPTMHERMLDVLNREDAGIAVPRSLRFAFTAGAAATPDMIRAFHDRGIMMKQGYGQTETSMLTCLNADTALKKAGSVGRPVRHAELRLIDPATLDGAVSNWRDVPVGIVGEIVARGPITMLGYWQRPDATAETLREGWVRTGDLATRDAEFDITLVGRSREMYISGGENVYPAEIEAALVAHPDVAEAAVVATPHPDWGEVGRAHLVPAPGRTITPTLLLDWLKTRLATFKQPREIVIESALPRTASGKIQKHRLVGTDARKSEKGL